MLVRKTYNIRQLKDELGEKIERARESCTGAAVVDIIVAQEILEVLEEILRQESLEKQREENIINGMKEEMDCFGNFDRRDEICVTCNCAVLCRENTEVVEKEDSK